MRKGTIAAILVVGFSLCMSNIIISGHILGYIGMAFLILGIFLWRKLWE